MEHITETAQNLTIMGTGVITWDNEEEQAMFTDSFGRVHTAAFLDPDTGDAQSGIKARSGLLISRATPALAKITRLKNEKVIVHYLD